MTHGIIMYREIEGTAAPSFTPSRRFVYRHLLIDRRYLLCNPPAAPGFWPRLRARVADAVGALAGRLAWLLSSNRPRRIPIRVL